MSGIYLLHQPLGYEIWAADGYWCKKHTVLYGIVFEWLAVQFGKKRFDAAASADVEQRDKRWRVKSRALTATNTARDTVAAISWAPDSDLWPSDTSTNDLAYRIPTELAQVAHHRRYDFEGEWMTRRSDTWYRSISYGRDGVYINSCRCRLTRTSQAAVMAMMVIVVKCGTSGCIIKR